MMTMVDKLDVRLNTLMPLRPEFEELLGDVKAHPQKFGFHPSLHYGVFGSLEPFGLNANFHGWLRHKQVNGQSHKLEILDVGQMNYSQVLADIERVVMVDPRRLEIMRLDLAADVKDVTVEWFIEQMRVKHKRSGAQIDGEGNVVHSPAFEIIYRGKGKSAYFGRRPNCFRVYDKTAELDYQFKKALRKLSPESKLPTFAETYGIKESDILTRIERQIGGSQIPQKLSTVGSLTALPDFNPFENVVILPGTDLLPLRKDYTFAQFEAGLNLMRIKQERGLDLAIRHIKLHNPSNPGKALKVYMPFLLAGNDECPVDERFLFESYSESVRKQIAA